MSPIDDERNEHLIPYFVFVKVDPTEKNKETLKYLKEKYPSYFENFKDRVGFACNDECFLDKLATIDLSNEVKAVIDKNLNLLSDNQLEEFKETDVPTNYIFLPEDEKITYSSIVGVNGLDRGDKDWYSLYIFANDLVMKAVKNELSNNILEYYEDGWQDEE